MEQKKVLNYSFKKKKSENKDIKFCSLQPNGSLNLKYPKDSKQVKDMERQGLAVAETR